MNTAVKEITINELLQTDFHLLNYAQKEKLANRYRKLSGSGPVDIYCKECFEEMRRRLVELRNKG